MQKNSNFSETNSQSEGNTAHTPPFIGKFLKDLRERKNINLKIISRDTKISPTLLESLEKNELEKLPNRAYVIGFVKSYCKALGIPVEDGLKSLEHTYNEKLPHEKPSTTAKLDQVREKNRQKNIFVWGIFVFAIVSLGIIFLPQSKKLTFNGKREKAVKTQSLSSKTPLKEGKIDLERDFVNSSLSTVKEKVAPAPETKKEAPLETPVVKKVEKELEKETIATAKRTFHPVPYPLYTNVVGFSESNFNEVIPESIRSSFAPNLQNLVVKANKGETWITYQIENGPIRQRLLRKDKYLLLKGKVVKIFLGNIRATQIFLNKKRLKVFGNSGVKSLVIPQEEGKNYKLPLFLFGENGKTISSHDYITNLEKKKTQEDL